MGKLGKRLKNRANPVTINSLENSDFEITNSTLKHLTSNFALLKSPELRNIRKSLFTLFNSLFDSGNPSNSVSTHLNSNSWEFALFAVKRLASPPKLGSVQRWVRCAALAPQEFSLLLINAIIRACNSTIILLDYSVKFTEGDFTRFQDFEIFPTIDETYLVEKSCKETVDTINYNFQKIEKQTDDDHIDIYIHPIDILNWSQTLQIQKSNIPFVNNGISLSNVLSINECNQLIKASTALGYKPNLSYSFTSSEMGAEGCVWLVNESITKVIYSRIEKFLPGSIGLNKRFRFYKYSNNATYRPHIDGAWPSSGIKDGVYEFNVDDNVWSKQTLLIYLNQEFQGGSTTFYFPIDQGKLGCCGVVPKTGSVLLFPHGDDCIPIVHEGSLVTDGFKYVIRTDVLYPKENFRS